MKNNTRIRILILLAIVWIWKPIPYEDVVNYQSIRQEVLSLRGGGQDSTGRSNNVDDAGFIPPKTNSRLSTNSGRKTGQPKDELQPTSPPT